ncbi:hypothetical protein G3T14_24010 [Methylobacterium sp. BTF04]|uniref:head-tail joining protein n=1 Tax=Methylobacterium sp. BTF04 TaxID=2708300 RepID=UPI0013D8BBE6|nr:hypothetical protein [Methylobacterium sp. BTF04]NEU15096.1 hypothetical protein [Methylobacterium sp. BTF04]
MDAFAMMVDAQFEDPNLALDAFWRAGGGTDRVAVRIIRKSPEGIDTIGGNQFDLNAMLVQIRLSEVAQPAKGDQVDLLDDAGQVTETVQVTGFSRIDSRKLVRTCEVSPVADSPDDDPYAS